MSEQSARVAVAITAAEEGRSKRWDTVRRLHRHKPAIIGEILLVLVFVAAIFGPFFAPYGRDIVDLSAALQGPSAVHWLGADELGRDLLTRILYGARVSLQVGFAATAVGASMGVVIGLISGYKGGTWLDQVIMAIMDAWRAFPGIILALVLVAMLGPSLRNVFIAIGVGLAPAFARLTRGQVLSVRENDYVTAARALGASVPRIIFRHVFPNVTAPLLVMFVMDIAAAILAEAGLSFLGVGVRPPTPSWGGMVRAGYPHLEGAFYFSFFPGMAIFITVMGALLFGNGLRDALDPKRRGR